MLGKILYVFGVICAIWCVLDILNKRSVGIIGKIILAGLVICTSWFGLATYYFFIKDRI